MSGAFNIDIEVGAGGTTGKIKIYCASLTDTWNIVRSGVELAQFHSSLSKEQAITTNKINLGGCPKVDDITACELFLSRLGCTAAVLRIAKFHDFLNVPKSVRDGLTYASHKPYGKSLREGYMQRHPRFVRRGGGKRWIRLTKDDRGGSLICYLDENNKNSIIASLKIGASTEIQNLKDRGIPNAFVLKSGKRQWVLQASSSRDYTMWQSQLISMLKEFGPVSLDNNNNKNNSSDKPKTPRNSNNNKLEQQRQSAKAAKASAGTGKILKENQEITAKIKKMKLKIADLAEEIDKYKELEIEMLSNAEDLKRKRKKQFEKDKEDLIAEYEVKQDNLRGEIEELNQKLENKTATEGGYSGLKTLFSEYIEINIDDYKEDALLSDNDNDDDDGRSNTNMLQNMDNDDKDDFNDEDGKGNIKYLHKHLHRHDHKHIHSHRHLHIHDQTGDAPITYTHTHTIAHTICHTNTQFKIKKSLF
eukprot:450997_1